jgi:hypothetical protein
MLKLKGTGRWCPNCGKRVGKESLDDSRDIIGDYPAFLDPTPPQSQPSHAFLSPTELSIREILDPNEPPQEEILKKDPRGEENPGGQRETER